MYISKRDNMEPLARSLLKHGADPDIAEAEVKSVSEHLLKLKAVGLWFNLHRKGGHH